MSLTPEQRRLRDGKIGASFLPYLMAGDEDKIYDEWRWQVGDPDYIPVDLSDNWDVQFGAFVEDFVLSWHARRTSRALTRRREVINHPKLSYVCCTLDSWRQDDNCVLDCKVTKKEIAEVCSFYLPQIVGQRDCLSADKGGLVIVHWAREPKEFILDMPPEYCREVWDRAEWFWSHVESLTPPVEVAPIAAPVTPIKTVCMQDSNSWAKWASIWLAEKPSAMKFAESAAEIKKLVEPDTKFAFGRGVGATRDGRGISIKEYQG